MIARLAAHLLGRHVADRAEHGAGLGVPLDRGRCGRVLACEHERLPREAEVEDLHLAVARHEHVLRLQIAVDDASAVSSGQAARNLDGVLDGLAQRHGRMRRWERIGPRHVVQLLAQRLAVEQLHDGVRGPTLAAEVEDRKNVGMRQRRDGFRLALEALESG